MAKAIAQAYSHDSNVTVVEANLKTTLLSVIVQDGAAEDATTRLCPNSNVILVTKDVEGYTIEALWTSVANGDMETSHDMICSRAAVHWNAVGFGGMRWMTTQWSP